MAKPFGKRYRLAVDIGGTFTDLVLTDEVSREVWTDKVLTSAEDPAGMVLHGLHRLMSAHHFQGIDLENVIHATTLVTNVIIERKGATTGFITTKGFRDVLHIGREVRYDLYDMGIEIPQPLVTRYRVKEVAERVDNEGNTVTPLVEEDVRRVAAELVEEGAEAIAIGFLHSFMAPAHENLAETIVRQNYPDVAISISSRVAPEIREVERFTTTIANAYVQPLAQEYLEKLSTHLQELGVEGGLFLMLSNGGIASVGTVKDLPIRLVESGPAAGVLAAIFFASKASVNNLIAFDMGGTTAKICLVNGGEAGVTYSFEVGRTKRFKRGSGLPIKTAAVDLIEIGAGGGSIAAVDSLGLLQVGPRSAGAHPGPACYGLGGIEPTVTDADLLLGYLNPTYFLAGEMDLDMDIARLAISDRLANRLGLDTVRAAWGIHDVVNENMASAVRIHIAEKGEDPRKYTLVATGGAGPVHAYHVASKLNMRQVVCPPSAGVASSLGLLVAPPKMDLTRTYSAALDEIDWEHLAQIYREMEEELRTLLAEVGVRQDEVHFSRVGDMRYMGQGHELHIPLPEGPLSEGRLEIKERFESVYQATFGRVNPEMRIEGVNWRLFGQGPERQFPSLVKSAVPPSRCENVALKGTRQVFSQERGDYLSTPVYDRYRLSMDMVFTGPAVIEERESTAIVEPSGRFRVDLAGNLVIEL